MDLLEEMGPIPEKLQEESYAITEHEILRKLHKLAAQADSLEEFERALKGIDRWIKIFDS